VDSYRTVAGGLELEIPKIKGSRFLASVAPAADEAEAMAHVDAARRLHHAARHVCWAWRTGEGGELSRSSDDGEPSGSAGKPILAAIVGADLTFLAVAVTRYFGGTKLGVGGLVRAYGGAAAEALAAVEVRVVVPTRPVVVEVGYDQLGVLEAFLAREGLVADAADYGERVTLRFDVPVAAAEALIDRLFEASSGRIRGGLGQSGPARAAITP
jgi:uncharacterized YigZ family protein